MAYQRWRRKVNADVRALAAESSGDELENVIINEEVLGELDDSHSSGSAALFGHDSFQSDYGFTDAVVSSDDSDVDIAAGAGAHTEPEATLCEELAALASKHKCTRALLDDLLGILRRHGQDVPKDARTLLKTPKTVLTEEKCGGRYAYFGIESEILRILSKSPLHAETNSIELTVNIDGVPLFKSSTLQFWPILCSFNSLQPFIVALFCGRTKPSSVQDYLCDFLHELQNLRKNGILCDVNEKKYKLAVKAFVCDAPARSFLKCTKSHSGYFACERCEVKGHWNGRVVLDAEETFPRRTDTKFNSVSYSDHQLRKSPLIDAGISCIDSFALDYMHLVCLGVVKRMLVFLRQGPAICRLSFGQRSAISDNLVSLSGKMPSEFARQPRSLLELDRWKATELRQFLLYTGSIALKDVISSDMYTHFLTLSVAISIMLNSNAQIRNGYLQYSKELLAYFVKKSKELYGDTFNVYNVHGLLHLPEDVEFFKCSLNDISGFQFENHLQTVKRYVRNSNNPLAQVSKRLTELHNSKLNPYAGKTVKTNVSTNTRDMCFLLQNEDFAFVKEKRSDGKFLCDVISQGSMYNLFERPCNSKLLNIVFVRNLTDRTRQRLLERQDLNRKVVCLPYCKGYALFPLLHEVERH